MADEQHPNEYNLADFVITLDPNHEHFPYNLRLVLKTESPHETKFLWTTEEQLNELKNRISSALSRHTRHLPGRPANHRRLVDFEIIRADDPELSPDILGITLSQQIWWARDKQLESLHHRITYELNQ